MRICGRCPIRNAGNATLTICDLAERGGNVMISRLIFPAITSISLAQITSMCQFHLNSTLG